MQTHSSVHTPISGCDYTGIAYSGTDSERRNDSWLVVTSPIIDSGAVLISDQSHEPMCFVLAFIFAFFGRLNNASLEKLGARHDRLCTTHHYRPELGGGQSALGFEISIRSSGTVSRRPHSSTGPCLAHAVCSQCPSPFLHGAD